MNITIAYFAFLCFIKFSAGQKYLSYVCHSFSSYQITRASNPNCYYSGDVLNTFEEIAKFYGYNTEVFEVETEDQYILTLFRISPINSTLVGPPVLLVHGSFTSSTAFTLVGNRSLAFILADEGYDVWLVNLRGTSYSEKHKFLNSHRKKYWDFTFHEYGIYDLKATINLVTSTTKQKVIYIGWSTGAVAYYVYNVMNPDDAIQKVRVFISLAPTVYPHLMKTVFVQLEKMIPFWIFKGILDTLFPEGVFLRRTPILIKFLLNYCFDSPSQVLVCEYIKDMFTGFDFRQEAPETFPVLISQCFQPIGLKMFYNWIQLIKSRKFQQFDYGNTMNLVHYGSPNPPVYNLSLINLPVYIIYAFNDFLSPEENVKLVFDELPEVAKPFGEPYRIKDERFCHSDMAAAKDIKPLLNNHIVEFLKKKQDYFNN